MEEKNGGEKLDDLEKGNTKAGSSSMNTEITKESASTPNEPPTSVNAENTTPNENSNSKGGAGEDMGMSATPTASKSNGCSVILLVVLGLIVLLLAPVGSLIVIVCFIVREIAAPKKWTIWVVLEWIALVGITGFLIASLTRHNLKNHLIWELELWKWCILLMVVVCGKLISEWIVNAVFLLIRLLFAHNLNVYCFAYGLKEKNPVFVWWGLVLIAWLVLVILFGDRGGTRSEETKMILDYVTRALASLSIGAGLWLGKDLLLWSIAISFQSKNFFESILKANFYKFVIKTLDHSSPRSVRERLIGRYGVFNWAEEISMGKKSVVSIKLFIESLSLDSNYKLELKLENGKKDQEKEIDAQSSGDRIWKKVCKRKRELESAKGAQSSDPKIGDRLKNAGQGFLDRLPSIRSPRMETRREVGPSQGSDPGSGVNITITRDVISSFFKTDTSLHVRTDHTATEEARMLFKLIGQTLQREKDCSSVAREDFIKWLEIACQECDSLESSLQNTRRGMEELNKLAQGIVLVLILIVWLLMMKVLSTEAVVLILSQFFVLTFMFGNTCKRIFEGIVFVFVTYPFAIGDRCLIEDRDEEVYVKEINILTTAFSWFPKNHKNDKDIIVYPNSVLASKHITKIKIPYPLPIQKRNIPTPPKLDKTDLVEFVVNASTSTEQIDTLNSKLKEDIKKKCPWIKDISVRARGFEDEDKLKMAVYFTYKYLWKDNDEKSQRKSQVVLGLKKILEDMGISK